jgi:N utilization substance protein B
VTTGAAASSARRQARERALGLLYEATSKDLPARQVVDELPVPPDPYATALAVGVDQHRDQLDEVVARHLKGSWRLDRLPVIDRTVLRLAVYELAHEPEVPVAVAISEAVELAKQFSTEDSGRFVNGVLGAVAAEIRPT